MPIDIDNLDVSKITIDGQDVKKVTADGQTVFTAMPDSGVSRWTFDTADTDNGTAIDSWGDNDGTISGATTGVSGANQTYTTNEAYDFDGTDDYVSTNYTPSFGTGEFTVTVWYNADEFLSGGGGDDNQTFLSTYDSGSEGAGFICGLESDYYRFWNNDDNLNEAGPASLDTWTFVVFTRRNGTAYVYENDATQVGSLSSSSDVSTSTDSVHMGRRAENGNHFNGTIDDPRIYNKGLTETEISNLYNTGSISG